ncbi:mechanosensitive ion channel family protein [Vogesella urethralis]|jgi:small-conductance mechanosensitive channel|uniref:mechanosensitive ion channel family protein n=1 Tax=Vogesella urethralis TaxID=2592656 RepID=UPI0011865F7F|nr:mechanosensitive ion channel domain-containing protein [Vogesella urethralis]MEC5207041.1 small-conductance mechanosensitive channel [Vogesella perlucida]
MLEHTSTLTFDRLVAAIQGPTGWLELLVAAIGVALAFWLSRRIHARYFASDSGDWGFGKYLLYRLVLPLSAQLWTQVAAVIWQLVVGVKSDLLVVSAMLLLWMSIIRILAAVVRHALPDGKLERSTEHFLSMLLWLAFASWAVGVDTVVLDWLESISFRVGKTQIDLLMILSALVWVSVIMVGAMWLSKLIEKRVMKLSDVDLSLRIVFTKLARTLLMVVGVMVALPIVGIDLTVLSVFGGALGVGLGFGLQKIASNYVSGFIILLDRSIRIGDRLMVDNRVGYVSKITSRFVVLKSADGSEILVPNEALIANTVINQSYTDKALWISLPVQVSYETNLEEALALLRQAATHPRVKTDPAPAAFVIGFADSGINLEVGLWVSDPENGMLSLRSEINLRIWKLFAEHGIQIPYPQREVRVVNGAAAE